MKFFKCERDMKLWNTRVFGKKAGNICNKNGYLRISIFGKTYLAHRVAYAMSYGQWPTNHIDHINRDRSDNRLENIRDVLPSVNHKNRSKSRLNTSGVTGVFWHKGNKKWQASIRVNGKLKHLGVFGTLLDAAAARVSANNKYEFSTCHGV